MYLTYYFMEELVLEKQHQLKLLQRKLDEADKWRKLLEKVQVFTGEQDAIKRLESHVHSRDTDDSMEMKAEGT